MTDIQPTAMTGELVTYPQPLTVAELIVRLGELPQDLPVVVNDSEHGFEWERVSAQIVDVQVDRWRDGRLFRFWWTEDYEMRRHPDREYAQAVVIDGW
ncbi:hypothetical protein PP484_gp41 [Gordonia phage Madeline]|uniref:Uncharacterized protein n=1 Tax=Gordonia phage Madeline TaxID=2591189 RepID=A0A514A361_9CAUD|nr:hypothetical protein PP484_gp41 [Gordonia phage Madeline]QDH47672.1 hypothetical protein SEA_MADELINE_69 [Gordonia phage Madeline]